VIVAQALARTANRSVSEPNSKERRPAGRPVSCEKFLRCGSKRPPAACSRPQPA
jgi:hypothetical protein